MRKWLVKRPKDEVIVTILLNKSDNTYSFVNLTKEHICPCRFSSIEDALHDMDVQITQGKIIKYYEILPTEISETQIMTQMCLLKRFGILDINKNVPYREHPNHALLYVYYDGDWHVVPKEDTDVTNQ